MSGPRIDLEIQKELKINKTCSCCGKIFHELPVETVVQNPFYWFNCDCQSTLVVPMQERTVYDFRS